ncbi:hypothetical protein P4U43_09500 [Arthrobacter sp. EH-1B-1]|uniref:Uncharacterized protein n=1 Tax=Arthrobacter vasquezii TaxID=2977629 RepID=A0ABT6CWZ0_9MICC|nr:hypothetical protein [Arthrobacter vasquezii]MDF9278022.1 hypothetical protein [Arthrobacter vasquezii]
MSSLTQSSALKIGAGGAAVGSVIPTLGAIIPAAVGVDIDVVMQDARDLVRNRHTLRQIVNVKGD